VSAVTPKAAAKVVRRRGSYGPLPDIVPPLTHEWWHAFVARKAFPRKPHKRYVFSVMYLQPFPEIVADNFICTRQGDEQLAYIGIVQTWAFVGEMSCQPNYFL
jgi:hypothetical protein